MPISATGISNSVRAFDGRGRRRASGFTLVEVLVVVVIVGIIASVVLLSTTLVDDDRELQQEARRMASLVELAADEAVLQGREFGLEFRQTGYRFVEYDPFTERWFEVSGDELLRPRSLAEDLRFELFLEDRRVLLPAEAARLGDEGMNENNRAGYAPHALIMSSGQLTPFRVELLRGNEPPDIALEVNPAGEVKVDDGRVEPD
mgnify:CR=1 FL=1